MKTKTITLFANCQNLESKELTWQEIYDLVKGDALKPQTRQLREAAAMGKTRDVAQLKRAQFPALMPSCHCREGERSQNAVTSLTGVCQADFDHLDDARMQLARERLMADPHVMMLYTSMSGHGLHVFYLWQLTESAHIQQDNLLTINQGDSPIKLLNSYFPQAFRQGNEYLASVACADYDPSVEPVVHLSSLCHDADAYYNPDARPFMVNPEQTLPKRGMRNPVCNTSPMKEGEWPEGWTSDEVCRHAQELRNERDLYGKGNRHNYLVGLSFLLSDYGVAETDALSFLAREYASYKDEPLDRLVADCYKRGRLSHGMLRLPRHKGKSVQIGQKTKSTARTPRRTRSELIADFLRGKRLRYDQLSQKTQQWNESKGQWVDLTDRLQNDLLAECNKALGKNIQSAHFREVLCSSVVPMAHPLRDYINGLTPWTPDQPDYIGEMLDMVTVEEGQQELWQWAARKWFVAMVAGWMQDESTNHEVLVLIGEQGIFKTSWIERLVPPQLRGYCSKQSTVRFLDKDEQLRATEFGLVNLDEIDQMSEQDLNALKSLVSATDINVRAFYGRNKERRQRVASYAASGNKMEFLSDQTGNRRWLPFHVVSILSPRTHAMPYEGMYAQAWYLVQNGFQHWFDHDDIMRMHPQTRRFSVETPEEQLLPIYFSPVPKGTPGAMLLTAAEISSKLTCYGNIRRPLDVRRLGVLLKSLGYQQICIHGRRGYVVMEKPIDSISAERRLGAMGAMGAIE